MKLYTLDNIKRDKNQEGLYDLFSNQVVPKQYTKVFLYKSTHRESMRPDLLSKDVYGVPDFEDEFLSLNGIVDPLSMVEGVDLFMFDPSDAMTLYSKDDFEDGQKSIDELVIPSKDTQKDPNRERENRKLPPNMRKSSKMKDVTYGDGVIKISDRL